MALCQQRGGVCSDEQAVQRQTADRQRRWWTQWSIQYLKPEIYLRPNPSSVGVGAGRKHAEYVSGTLKVATTTTASNDNDHNNNDICNDNGSFLKEMTNVVFWNNNNENDNWM